MKLNLLFYRNWIYFFLKIILHRIRKMSIMNRTCTFWSGWATVRSWSLAGDRFWANQEIIPELFDSRLHCLKAQPKKQSSLASLLQKLAHTAKYSKPAVIDVTAIKIYWFHRFFINIPCYMKTQDSQWLELYFIF